MNTTPIAFQIVVRPTRGRPLLSAPMDWLTFARVVASLAGQFRIVSFHAVHDHAHVIVLASREEAGRFMRKLKNRLRRALGRDLTFQRIDPEPIDSVRHLLNAIHYTFRQPIHHGSAPDPFHVASNLGDILGYRVLASKTLEWLRTILPRFDTRDLLRHLDGLELLEGTELKHLPAAAAAACGLARLEGGRAVLKEARTAAVHVGFSLGATTAQLAESLRLAPRTVRYLKNQPADPAIVRAIRLQIGLREQVGTRALRSAASSG